MSGNVSQYSSSFEPNYAALNQEIREHQELKYPLNSQTPKPCKALSLNFPLDS